MNKIKVPVQEMLDILDLGKDVLEDFISEHRRWSVQHTLIFKKDDKLWRAYYSVGATESQDETPWQYADEVECTEVEAYQELTTLYRVKHV